MILAKHGRVTIVGLVAVVAIGMAMGDVYAEALDYLLGTRISRRAREERARDLQAIDAAKRIFFFVEGVKMSIQLCAATDRPFYERMLRDYSSSPDPGPTVDRARSVLHQALIRVYGDPAEFWRAVETRALPEAREIRRSLTTVENCRAMAFNFTQRVDWFAPISERFPADVRIINSWH